MIAGQLNRLIGKIGCALESLGFVDDSAGQQLVFTGGGAELAGLADFAQSALKRPARIGKPPVVRGLEEAHAAPGFSTLLGLAYYALMEPVDIRAVAPAGHMSSSAGYMQRLWHALKDYF